MPEARTRKRVTMITINARSCTTEPYGLWALKAHLAAYLPAVDVTVRGFAHDASDEEILAFLEGERPDVIGLSIYVWNDERMLPLVDVLKATIACAPLVIAGGPQVASTDQRLTRALMAGALDALVVGEGELPLTQLLEEILAHGRIERPCEGVLIRAEGRLTAGASAPQRAEIDYLVNPYRVLPDLREIAERDGVIQYETSRGCPYSCTFCDQGHRAYRSLPVATVLADLSLFKAMAPRHIIFLDGTFNVKHERTRAILEALIQLDLGCEIHAEVKPDHLRPDEIALMARAGISSVELGFQSLHRDTLRLIKRRNRTDVFARVVGDLTRAGIRVIINTIIGLPEEGLSDWFESIDFCYQLGDVRIVSNTLKVLPNTELWDQAAAFGMKTLGSGDFKVLETATMTADDLALATLVNRLIKVFWNRSNRRAEVRGIVEAHFGGVFHAFLMGLVIYLQEAGPELESMHADAALNAFVAELARGRGQSNSMAPAPRRREKRALRVLDSNT